MYILLVNFCAGLSIVPHSPCALVDNISSARHSRPLQEGQDGEHDNPDRRSCGR